MKGQRPAIHASCVLCYHKANYRRVVSVMRVHKIPKHLERIHNIAIKRY